MLVTCVVTHGLRAWDLKKPGNTSGAAINAPKLSPVFSSPTGGHLENLKSYQVPRAQALHAWDLKKKPGNTSGAAINAPKLSPVFSSPTGGHLENLKSYQIPRAQALHVWDLKKNLEIPLAEL